MLEPHEPLATFTDLIKGQVQTRLAQAQELAQDAKFIEAAWARFDVDTLVALKVLDPVQACEIRQLLDLV